MHQLKREQKIKSASLHVHKAYHIIDEEHLKRILVRSPVRRDYYLARLLILFSFVLLSFLMSFDSVNSDIERDSTIKRDESCHGRTTQVILLITLNKCKV